jgi:hypothetical protein
MKQRAVFGHGIVSWFPEPEVIEIFGVIDETIFGPSRSTKEAE